MTSSLVTPSDQSVYTPSQPSNTYIHTGATLTAALAAIVAVATIFIILAQQGYLPLEGVKSYAQMIAPYCLYIGLAASLSIGAACVGFKIYSCAKTPAADTVTPPQTSITPTKTKEEPAESSHSRQIQEIVSNNSLATLYPTETICWPCVIQNESQKSYVLIVRDSAGAVSHTSYASIEELAAAEKTTKLVNLHAQRLIDERMIDKWIRADDGNYWHGEIDGLKYLIYAEAGKVVAEILPDSQGASFGTKTHLFSNIFNKHEYPPSVAAAIAPHLSLTELIRTNTYLSQQEYVVLHCTTGHSFYPDVFVLLEKTKDNRHSCRYFSHLKDALGAKTSSFKNGWFRDTAQEEYIKLIAPGLFVELKKPMFFSIFNPDGASVCFYTYDGNGIDKIHLAKDEGDSKLATLIAEGYEYITNTTLRSRPLSDYEKLYLARRTQEHSENTFKAVSPLLEKQYEIVYVHMNYAVIMIRHADAEGKHQFDREYYRIGSSALKTQLDHLEKKDYSKYSSEKNSIPLIKKIKAV